jgi:hypothetical protein
MFQPLNHNHDTKEAFMCHSVPLSLCALINPYQSITKLNQLLQCNQTDSQPGASMRPHHAIFVLKKFLKPKSIKTLPIPTPTKIHV